MVIIVSFFYFVPMHWCLVINSLVDTCLPVEILHKSNILWQHIFTAIKRLLTQLIFINFRWWTGSRMVSCCGLSSINEGLSGGISVVLLFDWKKNRFVFASVDRTDAPVCFTFCSFQMYAPIQSCSYENGARNLCRGHLKWNGCHPT